MLLTVFGMLSGNGNKRHAAKYTGIQNPLNFLFCALTTASKRESIVLNRGQVSWLVTLLPSFSFILYEQWTFFRVVATTVVCYLQLRDSP